MGEGERQLARQINKQPDVPQAVKKQSLSACCAEESGVLLNLLFLLLLLLLCLHLLLFLLRDGAYFGLEIYAVRAKEAPLPLQRVI